MKDGKPVSIGVHRPDRAARAFYTGSDSAAIHVHVRYLNGPTFELAVPGGDWQTFERVHEVVIRNFREAAP